MNISNFRHLRLIMFILGVDISDPPLRGDPHHPVGGTVVVPASRPQLLPVEREDEEAAQSREEPDPPGNPRLPGLAGDHGGRHTQRLNEGNQSFFFFFGKLSYKPGKPDVSRQPGMGVL